MNGTEKQIKWAEDIKKSALDILDQEEAGTKESYWAVESFGYSTEDVKAVRSDLEKFFSIADAKQIIDRRDYLTTKSLRKLFAMRHNG